MSTFDPKVVGNLRNLLEELHYDLVLRSVHPQYFYWSFPPVEAFDTAARALPERQRISFDCLLLGRVVRKRDLENHWGREQVTDLLQIGLLELVGATQIRTANYSLVAFLGYYFVVTLNPYYPNSRDPDASVYIGPDSLTLAAALVNIPAGGRGLDLCTGSGIQAIMLTNRCDQVAAVELNTEAVGMAAFNAALNGVDQRVSIHHGSLYDAAPDGLYNMIVSNPPFLPVPAGVHFPMCGNGGEDGLDILTPLLNGLPARLAEPGMALIYAEGVGDSEGPFVRHQLHELSQREELAVEIVIVARLSIKNVLVLKALSISKLKPYAMDELKRWSGLYERLKATHSYKYLLRMRHGKAQVIQILAFDSQREERGIEVEPGVILKPRV